MLAAHLTQAIRYSRRETEPPAPYGSRKPRPRARSRASLQISFQRPNELKLLFSAEAPYRRISRLAGSPRELPEEAGLRYAQNSNRIVEAMQCVEDGTFYGTMASAMSYGVCFRYERFWIGASPDGIPKWPASKHVRSSDSMPGGFLSLSFVLSSTFPCARCAWVRFISTGLFRLQGKRRSNGTVKVGKCIQYYYVRSDMKITMYKTKLIVPGGH